MLLIRTRIGPSAIHGLGLFAAADIPKGMPVWRFTPGFDLDLDPIELERLSPEQRMVLLHYGYLDARTGRYILCCDDTRFINHSNRPNLFTKHDTDAHGVDHAIRDIKAGEELTLDYGLLEAPSPTPGNHE